jgi:hypothetical protein
MRQLTRYVLILSLLFGAGQAGAKTLGWHGTLDIDIGALEQVRWEGSGVSTVNNSGGGSHLNTLRLAGGITGSGTIMVTDPDTTGTIPSFRLKMTLGTGTLSGISGAPPLNPPATLPVKGFTRVCLFTGCDTTGFLAVNNTTNSGATGLGIGGLLTMGGAGNVRISIAMGPWTIGPVSAINQTKDGGFKTITRTGFIHGAASSNSSTATPSGVIQLITPQQINTQGIAGNASALSLFAVLTLHFVPEPGLLLMIGAGVVGLGLLGRSRMKK